MNDSHYPTRRRFLAGASAASTALTASPVFARTGPRTRIAIVVDATDRLAGSPPAQWGLRRLEAALDAAGYDVLRKTRVDAVPAGVFLIVVAGTTGAAESLSIRSGKVAGRPALMVDGGGGRGLAYALSDLADRVAATPQADLAKVREVSVGASNPVRSVMRQFTAEKYDKKWFNDREGWIAYLDMLATHRFNRVHLAFGQAYDNLRRVQDSYFLFAYPFLVRVPGYDVRVSNLPDEERARNLETIRFASEAAAERGIDFQLGFWMHGYEYGPQSQAKHLVQGLNQQNHAEYCRDALTEVLRACPAVSSVSLRTHGESGVAEGSYAFWATVFDGVKRSGRTVEIDLHAKGLDSRMIDQALATGMPVNVAPKFSAEHMGLPYQEASIRELEMPKPGTVGAGLMTLSEGERAATRSSYADFLQEGRKYSIRYRVYPGTQRVLLWGDPAFAGSYSHAFQFDGAQGGDVMEPLTYRGRRGTVVAENRTGYVAPRLEPRWDWEKYSYWYRVWGRKLYDAKAPPEPFERHFGTDPRGRALAASLASASRILPTVTTAHLPSVACSNYWPEVYWNQPIVAETQAYPDTPSPKTFLHASAVDPEMFLSCHEFAKELLDSGRSGKYSPAEAAVWLDEHSTAAESALRRAGKASSVSRLRTQIDIEMQILLGRFFAEKLRAGALYAVFAQGGDRRAAEAALAAYRSARSHWLSLTNRARGVYADDLSASDFPTQRGGWQDRLVQIDQDIKQMAQRAGTAAAGADSRIPAIVAAILRPPAREPVPARHAAPRTYQAGVPLRLELELARAGTVLLHYRDLNQEDHYRTLEMRRQGNSYWTEIPGKDLGRKFPLQYYFEVKWSAASAGIFPGLSRDPAQIEEPFFLAHPA